MKTGNIEKWEWKKPSLLYCCYDQCSKPTAKKTFNLGLQLLLCSYCLIHRYFSWLTTSTFSVCNDNFCNLNVQYSFTKAKRVLFKCLVLSKHHQAKKHNGFPTENFLWDHQYPITSVILSHARVQSHMHNRICKTCVTAAIRQWLVRATTGFPLHQQASPGSHIGSIQPINSPQHEEGGEWYLPWWLPLATLHTLSLVC